MKIKIYILIAIFFFSFGLTLVGAQGSDIQFEKINPQQKLHYGLKRVKEKIIMAFCLTGKQKINYSLKLVDIRFRELIYVIENKDISQIEKVSQRYAATIGRLTVSLLLEKDDFSTKEFVEKIKLQEETLESIKKLFDYNSSEYRFVMDDINSVDIYMERLLSN
ncbi:MAG: hypothetical protein ABH812_01750 [bacterium]